MRAHLSHFVLSLWFFSIFIPVLLPIPSIARAEEVPPIYVSIVTHNEQPDTGRYPDFTESESDFWDQQDAVAAFADMLHEESVSYNWQSAWNFLLAANTFGTSGDSATDHKNIVSYLQGLGFSVNVHGHASTYNYADDAYLIDQLGSTPSGIMGGFIATPASSSELEDLWDTQHGDVYSYSWTPTALWGASGFGHQGDDDIQISGVWQPKDNDHFLTHSDNGELPVIGTYTSDWDGLDKLLAHQADGDLDPTVMHTATIMVDQDELLTQADRDATQAKIEALADETADGRIIWMTLEDVMSTWENDYNRFPGLFQASTESYLDVTTSRTAASTSSDTTTDSSSDTSDAATGSLIKTSCSSSAGSDDPCRAVYYLASDGKRHAFPNEKVYFTWYSDFDDVTTVSSSTMSGYTLGSNVTYHPGTRMVKFPSVNTVYAVASGGVLLPVESESVASSLYSSSWNQFIDDISEAFYSNYTFGPAVTSTSGYNVDQAEASVASIDENFTASL